MSSNQRVNERASAVDVTEGQNRLAWSIAETSRQLSVCERTVRRMLESKELSYVRIRGAFQRPIKTIEELLDEPILNRDNYSCAGPDVQETGTRHISANKVHTGGHRSSMQTAREGDALLEPPSARKGRP